MIIRGEGGETQAARIFNGFCWAVARGGRSAAPDQRSYIQMYFCHVWNLGHLQAPARLKQSNKSITHVCTSFSSIRLRKDPNRVLESDMVTRTIIIILWTQDYYKRLCAGWVVEIFKSLSRERTTLKIYKATFWSLLEQLLTRVITTRRRLFLFHGQLKHWDLQSQIEPVFADTSQ